LRRVIERTTAKIRIDAMGLATDPLDAARQSMRMQAIHEFTVPGTLAVSDWCDQARLVREATLIHGTKTEPTDYGLRLIMRIALVP
jgi:hypothetical protein